MEKIQEETEKLINYYNLKQHVEGGHFIQVYKSKISIQPEDNFQTRSLSSFIYFLLKGNENSYWHKLKSDEIWHFYSGSALVIFIFDEKTGEIKELFLGNKLIDKKNEFAVLVPKGMWFGASLLDKKSYTFVGCTMSPAWEDDDFELAPKNELEKKYPILEGKLNYN